MAKFIILKYIEEEEYFPFVKYRKEREARRKDF